MLRSRLASQSRLKSLDTTQQTQKPRHLEDCSRANFKALLLRRALGLASAETPKSDEHTACSRAIILIIFKLVVDAAAKLWYNTIMGVCRLERINRITLERKLSWLVKIVNRRTRT